MMRVQGPTSRIGNANGLFAPPAAPPQRSLPAAPPYPRRWPRASGWCPQDGGWCSLRYSLARGRGKDVKRGADLRALPRVLARRPRRRCSMRRGLVAPGFIDITCICGSRRSSTPRSSRAGRGRGGGRFTSVCCMPNTKPVNDRRDGDELHRRTGAAQGGGERLPDRGYHQGLGGEELAAIGAMQAAGAVAISDDGLPVMNARVMRRAMEFAGRTTFRSSNTARI